MTGHMSFGVETLKKIFLPEKQRFPVKKRRHLSFFTTSLFQDKKVSSLMIPPDDTPR